MYFFQVKRAFDYAYIVLTNAVNPLCENRDRFSILGRIVCIPDEVIRYRMWVEHELGMLIKSPIISPTLPYTTQVSPIVRAPRSLSSSGSTSSDSGGSSEVSFIQSILSMKV